MAENNQLTDKSRDRKYYTTVPRLVWAKSRSPYDYTFWCIVKDIAGESGECYLSTENLAKMCLMSTGKVSEVRKYWISTGLLKGNLRKDPEYPQPVWHLEVPDIWEENIIWAKKHPKIKDRLEYKKSLHHMKPSPHEEGLTPGEEGLTPHETKKVKKKVKKEKPIKKESTPDFSDLDKIKDHLEIPEIALYRKVTGRIPGAPQMSIIYETIRDHNLTENTLKKCWRELGIRGGKVNSLYWLTEWAVSGIPGKAKKKNNKPKTAEERYQSYAGGKYAEHIES